MIHRRFMLHAMIHMVAQVVAHGVDYGLPRSLCPETHLE